METKMEMSDKFKNKKKAHSENQDDETTHYISAYHDGDNPV
jgi:hypothetical protein